MNILKQIKEYKNQYGEVDTVSKVLEFIKCNKQPFERQNSVGHITGSCWIISRNLENTLLTHHKKLGIWIPTGGHSEGEQDPFKTAKREGEEETGIELLHFDKKIFSIDIHDIPEYNDIPAHKHFDFIYVFYPKKSEDYIISDESHDLKWIPLEQIDEFSNEKNVLSMGKRSRNLIKSGDMFILEN